MAGASSAAAGGPGAADSQIVSGVAGASRITLVECASGRVVADASAPAPLAAAPVLDATRSSVYAVTQSRELLRLSWPDLAARARVPLAFAPSGLAVAPGADGVVLAGGRGPHPVSAHEPVRLDELMRYPIPRVPDTPVAEVATVSALLVDADRQRFAIGFEDLPQLWEVAWNRDAPPVLLGFVHDYRSGEAVPLPGRLSPRPFKVPGGTRALVAGAAPFELARIDANGRFGVVNLDVRREIETPAVGTPADARRFAPWRDGTARGWAGARDGQAGVRVIEAAGWRIRTDVALPGEVLAVGAAPAGARAAGDTVLVAHRGSDGSLALARVRVDGTAVEPLARPAAGREPLRFVPAADGCVALLDADGRWLAGVAPAGGVSR